MRFIFLLFVFLSVFFIDVVNASPWDGRNEAAKICFSLAFEGEREECLNVIRESRYFDEKAIPLCRNLPFHDEKTSCLRAIRDKYYEDFEIVLCRGKVFSNERITCLRQNGRQEDSLPEPVAAEIISMAYSALDATRHGNRPLTQHILLQIIKKLERNK